MIEIKVSQGAKPGHGGILPAAKVTAEIAEARLVPQGQDVFSPTYHKAFSTPLEMTAFIAQLRELSGGKPVGFKLCIGDPREFMAIVKAMIQTGIYADFIVVDGGEGGTGAAPLEFSDSLGAPLNEGLLAVQNTLVGAGHPRPDQGRRERQDGHGIGDGALDGAGRGLVQLGPGLHVRGGLHPVAALPHEQVPGGRDDPGPQAPAGARRARQGDPRAQLPPQHGARPRRDDRRDGPGPHQRAAPVPRGAQGHPVPGAGASARSTTSCEPGRSSAGTANARFQGFWDQASAESFRPWSASEKRAAAAG